MSPHNLRTLIRETTGACVDSLPDAARLTLLAHAESADRMGEDVRAAILEAWAVVADRIRKEA